MLFQEIPESPWLTIFLVAGAVSILSAFIVLLLAKNVEDGFRVRIFRKMFFVLIVCGLGCWVGMAAALNQQTEQRNASFSKQLMDEYHATSSRSFSTIDHDSKPSNRTTTVLTRDGKDTPVLVKFINHDDKTMAMEFVVAKDESLYPKP